MKQHMQNDCDKLQIKCEKCDQYDFQISYKMGQHDCISLLKEAINLVSDRNEENIKSSGRNRSGDQRPRALEDFKHN